MSLKRAIPAFGLALIASLALSAAAAGSASAATQHWYAGGTKLAEGTPTGFTAKGTTTFVLKWTMGGLEFEIQCTTQGSGKENALENPKGGGAGLTKNTWLTFGGCKVIKPKNCEVTPLEIAPAKGEATEFEGKPALKFTGVGFEFVFKGGSCPWNGKIFLISGSITGIMNNATSSLEFTEASSELHIGGNKATFLGTSKLETTSGKTVTLAP